MMSGGPCKEPQMSSRKCNKMGKQTQDASTQCGKWLSLKIAIEKDEKIRAEVLENVDNILAFLGPKMTNPPTPGDERVLIASHEALGSHQIADLALTVQPLNTCMWQV